MEMEKRPGFTLSEVLIALALLGLVAAFAIPKVLQSTTDARRMATFEELYSTLSEVLYDGAQSGTLNPNGFRAFVLSRVNALKACPSNAETEGCWTGVSPSVEFSQPGFVAHNGAVVLGLDNASDMATNPAYGPPNSGYMNGMMIDWNGATGPNRLGEDELLLWTCYDTRTGKCRSIQTGNVEVRAGWLAAPVQTNSVSAGDIAANQALFNQLVR